MDPNPPSGPDKTRLPSDIQLAMEQHSQVLRVSYMEIASGINRLLRQGIPKEVISQVLNQTVEALAKETPRSPRTNSNPPAQP
jgi:hypothetical protein